MPYAFCSGATTGIVVAVAVVFGCTVNSGTVDPVEPTVTSGKVVSGEVLLAAEPGVAKLALPWNKARISRMVSF